KLQNPDKLFQKIKSTIEKAEKNYSSMQRGLAKDGVAGVGGPRRMPATNVRTSDGGVARQDPLKNGAGPQAINVYIKKIKWIEPEEIFTKLFANEKSSFWLDSSLTNNTSRFSYMGVPEKTVTYSLRQNTVTIKT